MANSERPRAQCERRPLLGLDPFGLLGEPEPFAHKLIKAGPYGWVMRFMTSLQRQVGLFAIPLRSRQHANRTCKNQSGSRNEQDRGCVIWWTLDFSPAPAKSGSGDPALRSPSVAGFRSV
jgi:hypothetical protein